MSTTRRSAAGTAAAAVAFLLPVAFSPLVYGTFWSPKALVLLVGGAAGLVFLAAQAAAMRPAALAALGFVAAVAVSTALSPAPRMALVGLYNWGTGAIFWVAVAGVWALGASVERRDQELIGRALLAGIGISAVVAVAQAVTGVGLGFIDAPSRATGLAGNAVHLGGLAAASAAYAAWQRTHHLAWSAVALVAASVVQLSGTRFALLLLPLVAAAAFVRGGRVRGLFFVAALALGALAGGWLADAGELQSAAGRSADDGTMSLVGGGGTRVRLEVWRGAPEAIAERPVLGHGPGRFRAATSADRSIVIAQLEGGDALYVDAHNLLLEHAVTTGVIGVAALIAWLLLAARGASGPLLAFAVALALMALVQPSSVGTTPLMALALGAAAPAGRTDRRPLPRVLPAAAAAVGLAAGLVLLVGDHHLEQARLDLDVTAAERADRLLRAWPQPASMVARAHSFAELDGRSSTDTVIRWRAEALRRDPTDPDLAVQLAREARADGRLDLARESFEQALKWNPYSVAALVGLADLAEERGDLDIAVGYVERAIEVRRADRLEQRLRRLEDAKRPGP